MLPLLLAACLESSAAADWIDLRQAVVVTPHGGTIIETAQRVLTEEVARRTGITLTVAQTTAIAQKPCVLL